MAGRMWLLMTGLVATVTVGVVSGQTTKPPAATWDRLADQELKLQVQFNRTYFTAAAEAPVIPQLYLSDKEALDVCKPHALGHEMKLTRHPHTCAAYVQCRRIKKLPVKNTVYRIIAMSFAAAEGTFWDMEKGVPITRSTDNDCPSDPCKTGKGMTDGRHCYSYLACARDGDAAAFEARECDHEHAFDVARGACVPDEACKNPKAITQRYKVLYCNATVPKHTALIPGVKLEAYYNRTVKDLVTGKTTQQASLCPGGMVFDTSAPPQDCKCTLNTDGLCPKTLMNVSSSNADKNWDAVSKQDGQFKVEANDPRYRGWASFDGSQMSFYSASALANNELAGDFTLSFSFALRQMNQEVVALASNSLDLDTCRDPSICISLTVNRNVVANVTTVKGKTITVQSRGTFLNPQQSNTVELRRDGDQLTLVVNSQEYKADQSLGRDRLRKTSCGLNFAKRRDMKSLDGWVDKVTLISRCDKV